MLFLSLGQAVKKVAGQADEADKEQGEAAHYPADHLASGVRAAAKMARIGALNQGKAATLSWLAIAV